MPAWVKALPKERKVGDLIAVEVKPTEHPAPWERLSLTRPTAVLITVSASAMLLIAILVNYIPAFDMVAYVPYAVGQGIVGWGGYLLSRLCHWEAPYPKVYKMFRSKNTLLWWVIGMGLLIIIQIFTFTFTQLTANTFLVGAYVVLAGATESQFFHVTFIDVGATLGRLIGRKLFPSRERVGEIIGKIAMIPGSDYVFMTIHTEYQGNPVALFTVILAGTLFCAMYAISDNSDAVFWTHMCWNLLLVVKFGGVVPS